MQHIQHYYNLELEEVLDGLLMEEILNHQQMMVENHNFILISFKEEYLVMVQLLYMEDLVEVVLVDLLLLHWLLQ